MELRELAADCLVRIGSDLAGAPDEGGSGVWLAPGIVLTCAHVVPIGRDSKVEVGWRGNTFTGTVTDQVPSAGGDGLWPFPDLAVVQVIDAPEHPCAWLSDAPRPSDGASLVAFGHSAALGEGLRRASVEGRLSGWHTFGEGRYWQFKGNELVSGMSGGLVLDVQSGAVCAIITTTIGEGADRGGYLVPLDGLRQVGISRWRELLTAHDQFHGRDRRWTVLRDGLPLPPHLGRVPINPTEEVELLGLLAQLPMSDAPALLALLTGSLADGRPPNAPPAALRDVAYALLDGPCLDAAWVLPLLRMTHQLAGAAPGSTDLRELYDWATALAAQHGRSGELRAWRRGSALGGARSSGVISVEIVPGAADVDRFRLSVSVQHDRFGCRRLYCDEAPLHALAEVKQLACEKLVSALCWLEGNALVEFVVPLELFDEPFDELVATKSYTNVGRKYPVVLRDYDRQFDPTVRYDWNRRWQRTRDGSGGIRWIACTEDLTPEEFSAELEQHPETTIVALTRRPSSNGQVSGVLRVALDSGMPIAVWRRGTCPEHDTDAVVDNCSGRKFRDAFGAALASSAADLPEVVRLLRNKAAGLRPAPGDHDCRGTVLLWDDPGRATQRVSPVREPPYQPLENTL